MLGRYASYSNEDYLQMKLLVACSCVLLVAGCGTSPPTSPDELLTAYKAAFEAGDDAAVENLVYWNDVPDDKKGTTLNFRLMLRFSGAATVTAKVRPQEEDEFFLWDCSLETDQAAEITVEPDDPAMGGVTMPIPIGQIDGQFYFGAIVPSDRELPAKK